MASLGALLDALVSRVDALEKKLAGGVTAMPTAASPSVAAPAAAPAASAAAEVSAQEAALTALIQQYVTQLKDISDKIGGDAPKLAGVVAALYEFNRKLVAVAPRAKKPDAEQQKALAQEMAAAAAPAVDMARNRDAVLVNHAKAVEGAVAAFRWALTDPASGVTPKAMVEAGMEAAEYSANMVRRASKEKNLPDWLSWANCLRDGLKALLGYVGEHYKTGLGFNGAGAVFADAWAGAGSAKPAAAAPAPAAAPATPTPAPAAGGSASDAAARSALFAQLGSIDQSSGKTAGLKHVTKDMKSSALKDTATPAAAPTPKPAAPAGPKGVPKFGEKPFPTGTPCCKFADSRWKVEFQTDLKEPLHISDVNIKQDVYIYGCANAVIFVDAKCKSVLMDTCYNLTVVIDSALSGVEVVNSKKMKIQVQKSLPSVAIDKTDGILVGLSWASRGARLVTAKSSEMNVTFPVSEAEDADWVEQPIPEQFVTTITGDGKLTTGISELYIA